MFWCKITLLGDGTTVLHRFSGWVLGFTWWVGFVGLVIAVGCVLGSDLVRLLLWFDWF